MAPITHTLDPKGDVTLVAAARDEDNPHDETRFPVSSRHLTLASPYFETRLKICWPEGKVLSEQGKVEMAMHDCDADVLLIILNILHCHLWQIPQSVTLDMMIDLALTTDLLECHEAVNVFGAHVGRRAQRQDVTFDRRGHQEVDHGVLGPIDTGNLPIPKWIRGKETPLPTWKEERSRDRDFMANFRDPDDIDNERIAYLEKLLRLMEKHIFQLATVPDICSTKCDALCLRLASAPALPPLGYWNNDAVQVITHFFLTYV
ncbi:hypothetical protein NUU61_000295 [Penicillium alfredii]|uniref:BTB domain-containing protein n=1 Tax=Penicillium alfredii TaxID=1506179 RepID=A0A9W9G9E1_9EURO|nr:uncharacterized protein NUU61_000295 [Penicillium alfredii]KAJ5114536.1 hypothetical protein NUU61_000295 [Penicillium alfredii]